MHVHRERWARFIRTREYVWRFLYARGDIASQAAEDINPSQLKEFLDRLAATKPDTLFLARLYFVTQPAVRDFFINGLNDLLRTASRTTDPEKQVVHGGVRGKVDWPTTLLTRATNRIDAGTFVTRGHFASFNVPENQLLKLFLTNISRTVEVVSAQVGTGAMVRELLELKSRSDSALKQPWLREVDRTYAATSLMRQRALRARNWRYGRVAALQVEFDEIGRMTKWETILKLLRRGWLAPIQDDDLFELYTLVSILEVLTSELGFGKPVALGLIKRNRQAVAQFHRASDGATATVYFDQSPVEIFGLRSEYTTILDKYVGITGVARRPDIIIRFGVPGGSERRVLVECKRSDDDEYRRDSIYKALGYLKDFAQLWDSTPGQYPKAMLVFPGTIRLATTGLPTNELELVGADNTTRIGYLLSQSLTA